MKTITVTELNGLLSQGNNGTAPTVLDVRTPAEYAGGHASAARNVPLDQFDPVKLHTEGRLPKDAPVYLLCQAGGRARKADDLLAKAGFANGVIVEGGTHAWIDAGLPVEGRAGGGVISLERQVRIAAGSLVLLGVVLAVLVNHAFIGLSAFVGAGLVFAGITDFCGMGLLLARFPWNQRKSA